MVFAAKVNVHHGHWSDSFKRVVGSSFADRIISRNGRLFHPNWIGADLGPFRIDAEQLDSEHFLAVLVTLINQRNSINPGSGGQYHLTLRSAPVPAEELMAIVARLRAAASDRKSLALVPRSPVSAAPGAPP